MKEIAEKALQHLLFRKKIRTEMAIKILRKSMRGVPDVGWMFHDRGVNALSHWARNLHYFRFVRCDINPRNTSSDHFCCKFFYQNEENMHVFLESMKTRPERQADPTSIHHLDRHPDLPGYGSIRPRYYPEFDAWCCIYFVRGYRVVVTVYDSEKPYTVTAKDFEGAKRIEAVLHPFASWVIDPPQDNWLCLCPKYWPEVFAR